MIEKKLLFLAWGQILAILAFIAGGFTSVLRSRMRGLQVDDCNIKQGTDNRQAKA